MGPDDLRRNALGQVLAQLAQRDAFHQLRTQQQLGYLVHMSSWTTLSVRSLVSCQTLIYPQSQLRCEPWCCCRHHGNAPS
jgi:secreted Zn-dependent insulinase-like peptidase